jgi:tRNA A-37 threonylcarbamoyl transferase component Bud32
VNPAQPGDLLAGRYSLRRVIGQGGMGTVWLATDRLLARDVAIKETVRPPQLDDADWAVLQERSLREARTAARLHHPNIVGVFDVLEHDGRPWLVMQLVPYPSLRDVVADSGPLWPAQAAHVGLRVLAAIRAAHADGVLHRDVKPGNVLLGPDDQIYLTDFGLAVAGSNPSVTVAGIIMGSPAYMAPERARAQPATPATDLWALGATLYAAVEGRDPFERNSTMAVLTAIVADEPDAPARAGVLWPVISGLLRKDPAARLSADETGYQLRRICEDTGTAARDRAAAGLAVPVSLPGRGRAGDIRGAGAQGTGARPTPALGTPAEWPAAQDAAALPAPAAWVSATGAAGAAETGAANARAANAATANAGAGAPGALATAAPAAGFDAVSDGWSRHDQPSRRRPAARVAFAAAGLAIAAGLAVAAVVALTGNNGGHTAVPPVRASHPASTASRRAGHGHASRAAPSSPATRPVAAVSHKPLRHTTSPAPQPTGTTPPVQTSPAPSPTPSAAESSPPVSATPTPSAGTTSSGGISGR